MLMNDVAAPKLVFFTGATFNDGDFGASVKRFYGIPPQKSAIFLHPFFFF